MTNEKVFAMSFAKVYPMLIAKAERKGRSRDEVFTVTAWLTGYPNEQLEELLNSEITYGDFFRRAPALHPARASISLRTARTAPAPAQTPRPRAPSRPVSRRRSYRSGAARRCR